mmetsp:Transcript_17024/g.41835  ORF Transcript_17024/g.41835 Transcript_17024/m.41835 type:complete len:200 (-) Transcript_17024:245-844(-)
MARRSQEVVSRLIGAREGAALRRVSYDASSVSLATYLSSDQARPLREAGIKTLATLLKDLWSFRKAEIAKHAAEGGTAPMSRSDWPESAEARVIREREEKTQRKAVTVIVLGHLQKLARDGPKGVVLLCAVVGTALRVCVLAVAYAAMATAAEWVSAACRASWRVVTAPARFLASVGKSDDMRSSSSSSSAGEGEVASR